MSDIASFWNVDETDWRALMMIMKELTAAAGGGIPERNPNWDPGCGCYGGKN